MVKDYSKHYNDLTKLINELETKIPSVMKGFNELKSSGITEGVLKTKIKALIAMGIAISLRCDRCIAFYVKEALNSGASSEEILETIGVAVVMGGEPAVLYGCEAMEALEQFVVLEQ